MDIGIDPGTGTAGGIGLAWMIREVAVQFLTRQKNSANQEEASSVDRIVAALEANTVSMRDGNNEIRKSVEAGTERVSTHLGNMYEKLEDMGKDTAVLLDRVRPKG